MYCPQCGTQAPDNSAFCPSCGADLRVTAVAPPVPQPAPTAPVPPAAAPPAPAVPVPPASPVHGTPVPPDGPYPKAPLGGRLLALIADSIIAAALMPLGLLLVYSAAIREEVSIVGFALAALGGLWQMGYLLARDAAGGAGFGKRLTGLVVVSSQTGGPARAGSTIVRQVVLVALGFVPLVGSLIEPIVTLTDKDGRRIGDKAAKTQVARSSDVAARGIAVPRGKGLAIGVLIAALLISIIGSVVGGVVFARSAYEATGGIDSGSGIDSWFEDEITGGGENPATPPEDPLVEPEAVPGWEDATPAVNPETAVEAVGSMLYALMQDDVGAARTFATRSFQEEADWFFRPVSGALITFEVVDVYPDAATWTVEVAEQWNSGPETTLYFVIEEDGQARVDALVFPDEF